MLSPRQAHVNGTGPMHILLGSFATELESFAGLVRNYASLGLGDSDNSDFSACEVSVRRFCCNSLTQLVTV